MNAPQFLLGTAMPSWLPQAGVPLFVSDTRMRKRKTMPRAAASWAADSGGFSELQRHGQWTVTPAEYVARLYRYRDEIGSLLWAAPQDWMFTHPSDTCRSSWSTMSILITNWMGELWLLSCRYRAGGPWGSTTSSGRGFRSRTSFRGWVTC